MCTQLQTSNDIRKHDGYTFRFTFIPLTYQYKVHESSQSLRDDVSTKDHFDATGRRAANGNIKEADGVSPVFSV